MTVPESLIFKEEVWKAFIQRHPAKTFIVFSDTNTEKHCLPLFIKHLPEKRRILTFTIQPGEASKTLQTAEQLWQRLLNEQIDRDALFITLGGGVVSDLGGFIASGYKRGIELVNVPTTHLAMTDAALGGKNGVNFGGLKNQIGTVKQPEAVWIYAPFLETLPERELKSGWIETVKHALIANRSLWDQLKTGDNSLMTDPEILRTSAYIKMRFALKDPDDRGIRQALNFGHTVGHALESDSTLLHGEAVAFGMLAESYLSMRHEGLNPRDFHEIEAYLESYKPQLKGVEISPEVLLERMLNDKKNKGGEIRFSLIPNIGEAKVGVVVSEKQILDAIEYARQKLIA